VIGLNQRWDFKSDLMFYNGRSSGKKIIRLKGMECTYDCIVHRCSRVEPVYWRRSEIVSGDMHGVQNPSAPCLSMGRI
jgi:hypothetical protein